ncbi:MAG: hypothetical protein OSJ37_04890 [Muribaculaceae bacterium]|jgi:tetratricopeptide (TPR) repeat protein|nr:hypothetical protein [Muribaculaceae bacterium]
MKKFTLFTLALATAMAASAQANVLKDAERAMKEGKEAKDVVAIITPAFTNPETQNNAQTYVIPGKASFSQYDHLLGLKQFNKLPENGDKLMGTLLVQGYEYFAKALPLDSVPDSKGKIKTKYSKDIIGTLVGHFSDYSNAGADLYNAKDYANAYKAWDIFCSIPEIPAAAESLRKSKMMPSDTIFGEIAFNQALAAWQSDNLQNALDAFMKAKKFGYNKKQLYDYAISVASNLNNNDMVLELSKEAIPLYGKEDPMYMSQIVNFYLQSKQLDKAFEIINQAIAQEPNNAQYYVIQGVLYENSDDPAVKAKAIDAYKKAKEIDPKNDQAVYGYGRQICEQAYALADEAPTRADEYAEYFATKLKPLFEQAAAILEEAYTINPDNMDVLKYLENVYYNLNDEKMLNDVKKRMSY